MLYNSLIASGVILLVTNVTARFTGRYWTASIVAGLGNMLGFGLASLAVMANALLIVLTGLLCQVIAKRQRTFLWSSIGATTFTYLAFSLYSVSVIKDRAKFAAQKFPFESMSERLAYENHFRETSKEGISKLDSVSVPRDRKTGVKATSLNRLNEIEGRIEAEADWRRTQGLEDLHAEKVAQFIESPGFGVERQMARNMIYDDSKELDPISLPSSNYKYPDESKTNSEPGRLVDSGINDNAAVNEPTKERLEKFHLEGFIDFVNSSGFGYIKDRENVSGFQPHRFSKMPKIETGQRWVIQDLELISLLKHEQPVAYISEHLPRMDELREAKTRPLNAFERDALEVLRRGEDLKVQNAPREIRMLGSIRAVKQCLQCHDVERGDLLGAFSYRLRPE
jgi:hypothetical protein